MPAEALAHALRTPLFQLDGLASLLLGGGGGRLDDEARATVLALHDATRALGRTVDLLGYLDEPPPAAAPRAWQPLAAAWDPIAARHGWRAIADDVGEAGEATWPRLAWSDALVALVIASLDERGVRRLELTVDGRGTVRLHACPFDAGGEDTALAAALLHGFARRARLPCVGAGSGRRRLALGPFARGPVRRCWQR